MTAPDPTHRRAIAEQAARDTAARDCAAAIVADLQHQGLPLKGSLAVAAAVVTALADYLPANQRAGFLRAYANDLSRQPHLDA